MKLSFLASGYILICFVIVSEALIPLLLLKSILPVPIPVPLPLPLPLPIPLPLPLPIPKPIPFPKPLPFGIGKSFGKAIKIKITADMPQPPSYKEVHIGGYAEPPQYKEGKGPGGWEPQQQPTHGGNDYQYASSEPKPEIGREGQSEGQGGGQQSSYHGGSSEVEHTGREFKITASGHPLFGSGFIRIRLG